MPINLKKLMAEANAIIDTVSVHDVLDKWASANTIFIDVRKTAERVKVGTKRWPGSSEQ